jgi:predicted ATPase
VQAVRVRELRLRHYRAFANARLVLDNLTFLVGRNGAGKSTLMDALSFISEAVTDSLSTALERRGNLEGIRQRQPGKGPHHDVSLAIRLDQSSIHGVISPVVYGFRLGSAPRRASVIVKQEYLRGVEGIKTFERSGKEFHSSFGDLRPAIDPDTLVFPKIAGHSVVWNNVYSALRLISVHQFSPRAIQAEPQIGSQERLTRHGSNAGDILKDTRALDLDWIVEHLSQVTPGITGIEATARAGRRVIVFHQDGQGERKQSFDASVMSDGTVRSLGILLSLRQTPRPSLVLLDEIEDSLHPYAQSVLLDAINAASEDFPVVVSTHNPEILSHATATADRIRIVQWNEGTSEIFHLSGEILANLRPPQTVGRLLRSNALWTEAEPSTSGAEADFFRAP